MNILLTGGSGFVGYYVKQALSQFHTCVPLADERGTIDLKDINRIKSFLSSNIKSIKSIKSNQSNISNNVYNVKSAITSKKSLVISILPVLSTGFLKPSSISAICFAKLDTANLSL